MNPTQKERLQQDHETTRKPYSTPRIETYGDLRQLTHTVQGGMIADNPGQETNMTIA